MYKVEHFGNNHNLTWELKNESGHVFENKIYKAILKKLKSKISEKHVFVMQTQCSNDGGKDIVIRSFEDIELFGVYYRLYDKNEITIYFECKSTKNELRLEKIISNAVKSKYDKIDYFALITNSTINPNTYFLIENELKPYNIEFILIDQYLVAKAINKNHIGLFETHPNEYKSNDKKDDFYLEYQVSPSSDNEYNGFEIVFLFRNYGNTNHHCRFSLMTNVNWNMEERALEFIIAPNLAISKKVHLRNDNTSDFNSLIFRIENNKNNATLQIRNLHLSESFEPPFISEERKNICSTVLASITNPKGDNLFCFWGEAGIGKTRLVKEIFKELQYSLYDIYEIHLNKNNQKTVSDIIRFLNTKNYILKKSCKINEFSNCINASNNYVKTALIFIDDFHYAENEFIEQIKKIHEINNKTVRFIICGRTDYSYGNCDYYSFVELTKSKFGLRYSNWLLSPLTNEEIRNLILVMIDKIPISALDVLVRKSNNNPLFVVQYIEYLLGEKLVYIINRNSVGIIDPSRFSAINGVPDKITDIYKLRLEHLQNEKNGQDLLFLLLVISLYNGEIHKDIILKYYDDLTLVERLVNLRYIVFKNNYYRFIHESLFIYIKKLAKDTYSSKISKYILSINDIEKTFDKYQLGRLYLWNRDIKSAKSQFVEIVSAINNNENISNLNINMQMYDYIYDVYATYKSDIKSVVLLEKLIKTRIYITLHHLMPYNAALECDYCIKLINTNNKIINKDILINTILAQKAHALLNSGKNLEGYIILNEIQSKFLSNSRNIENEALFDIYDRLLAIYIKFNIFDVAKNYAELEMKVANDDSLRMIAHRTHSKLYYLQDYKKAKYHVNEVNNILKVYPTIRIELNNKIYEYIIEITYNKIDDYFLAKKDLENILSEAKTHQLNRTEIQAEMVLAALMIKYGEKDDIKISLNHIEFAINNSITYGINSYLWQLYNLKAIIQTKLGIKLNDILHTFQTVLDIIENQNLNFIGNKDLCYSNILALSNVFIFLSQNVPENSFNLEISKVKFFADATKENFCFSNYRIDLKDKHEQYERAKNKQLLFVKKQPENILKDDTTGYFIALS